MTGPPIIVMKFGGTSVATGQSRSHVIERVRQELALGGCLVVVVSAMGRGGDPYATDTLLSLVENKHCAAHDLDLLMGAGELISAVVLAAELNAAGIPALALSGAEAGIVTDSNPGNATIKYIDISAMLASLAAGSIVVVAGFQGIDEQGIFHTLGRGGSDTSACAIAVALKAQRVDIYTDVDGVYSADPRVIEDASVLQRITADELFQMARHGAKVVHAPAAELALHSGVQMRVRSTFSGLPGTEVVSLDSFRPDAVATAVTTVGSITRLRVRLPYVKDDPKRHMQVQTQCYQLMAASGISIDMFTPMNDRLVFSISSALAEQAAEVLRQAGLEFAARDRLGKVTLVGSGMHGVPGVMAQVADCLRQADIDILQIADSHATISLLVDESDLMAAAGALHRAFAL
jgi:aspartate kinase